MDSTTGAVIIMLAIIAYFALGEWLNYKRGK